MNNALVAIAAARHVGVMPGQAIAALCTFEGVKRRMETIGEVAGITLYDDFAHHPTAIRTTMKGLKERLSLLDTPSRIIAVIDPRSNTMKMGCHNETLADSVSDADYTIFHIPDSFSWSLFDNHSDKIVSLNSVEKILDSLVNMVIPGDHILIMSNGGFEKIHERLIALLENSNAQNK